MSCDLLRSPNDSDLVGVGTGKIYLPSEVGSATMATLFTNMDMTRVSINPRRLPNLLLGALGRGMRALGVEELGKDLGHVGLMLSWVTEENPSTYIGEPCGASPEAGERMLDAFSDEAADGVDAALEGKPPYYTPLGWSLRFIEPSR